MREKHSFRPIYSGSTYFCTYKDARIYAHYELHKNKDDSWLRNLVARGTKFTNWLRRK